MYCLTKIMTGHKPLKDKPWRWGVRLENDPDGKFIFELSGNEATQEAAFRMAGNAASELISWWESRPEGPAKDKDPLEVSAEAFARRMRERGRDG